MKKLLFILLIISFSNLICPAQLQIKNQIDSAQTQSATKTDELEWPTIQSEDGLYSVKLPVVYAPVKMEVDSQIGKLKITSYSADQSGTNLAITSTKFPDQVDLSPISNQILEQSRDKTVASFTAKLLSSSAINKQGFAGIEFSCENANDNIKGQIYLVANQVIVLLAFTPKESQKESALKQPLETAFFNSFTINKVEPSVIGPENFNPEQGKVWQSGYGFNITLPMNWQSNFVDGTLSYRNPKAIERDGQGSIIVNVRAANKGETIDSIANRISREDKLFGQQVNKGFMTVDNIKAFWIVHRYQRPNTQEADKNMRIFVLKSGQEFMFTCVAPEKLFDSYQPLYQKIFTTVHWNK